ncbi:MAG TPA: NAD-dependent epimerase/dehydratase family protein [Planctomycetaceae bacterium]|nr:NAD-dependent epimerase/dehydratase family protein [Planctomycetaceae bacterium]
MGHRGRVPVKGIEFVQVTADDLILVTGATGLVGSHVVEQAVAKGYRVRALVRPSADASLLRKWNVELIHGDLDQPESLASACDGVSIVIHCAAKVGDWGPTEEYRRINVTGSQSLLDAALATGKLKRWVQISSLGVYEGKDHYGTDEATPPSTTGIDGYTLTKVESELLVCDYIRQRQLRAVVLRPGFIYGPRDRTVLPRLTERLRSGKFAFLGSPDKLMNNTFVGNLCEAIWLAIERDDIIGEVFNIRDPRAVTKREFIDTVCNAGGIRKPTKIVPLFVTKLLATAMESTWKMLGKKEAPLLNSARIKFLGLNLDYSIDKAISQLGYNPSTDFRDAMPLSIRDSGDA